MRIHLVSEPTRYDGRQLATSFVDEHSPGEDDAVILFEGEADVPVEHLVDLEDAEAGLIIYGPHMAHVVVEHRDMALREAVVCQRLLVRLAAGWVAARSGTAVEVRGDDLFVGPGKLSVSVATESPRGSLIHLGVNVETDGTPVKTAGLRDLRIAPGDFLRTIGRLYADEMLSVAHAASKVRSVS